MNTLNIFTKHTKTVKKAIISTIGVAVLSMASMTVSAFDHEHKAWTELLQKHIKV